MAVPLHVTRHIVTLTHPRSHPPSLLPSCSETVQRTKTPAAVESIVDLLCQQTCTYITHMHTPTRRLSPFSALQRVIFLTARKKDELEIIRKCICSANRLSYQRFTKEFSLLLRGDGFCALAREVPERCMIQRKSVKKLSLIFKKVRMSGRNSTTGTFANLGMKVARGKTIFFL